MDAKILLVEDNDDDIQLTLRAFKKKNILNEIVIAKDGEEALDFLFGRNGKPSFRPSLILLDLKLPKLDGLEVLEQLQSHEKTRYIPAVVLTTSNEEDDIVKSYTHGAKSYIRKPVDFNEFTEAVGHLGLYWLMLNEPYPQDKDN